MVSKPKDDHLVPGTLVKRSLSWGRNDLTMVIVDVLPASSWGLGADESYDCYLPNGLVKRYYRYELYKVS